jgi:hypothetical protein
VALVLLLIVGWGIALGVPATQRRLAGAGTTSSRRELDALRTARESVARAARSPRGRAGALFAARLAVATDDRQDHVAYRRQVARLRGHVLAVVLLLVAAYGAPKAMLAPSGGMWWLLVRMCVLLGVVVCVGLLTVDLRAALTAGRRPQAVARQRSGALRTRPTVPGVRGHRTPASSWSRATAPTRGPLGVRPTVRVSWSSNGASPSAGVSTAPRSRRPRVEGQRRELVAPARAERGVRGHAPNPAGY